ncbi:DNA-directed RNA polymerase III, subunit Rpc31 [Pholiota molesta]|nr:DNA-directed RNA polymerase III, subunit Rpc31 [Pholiota molesta]
MSRGGGRGGRGGGWGGGRGGFSNALPPMGLTFADLQNLSREATALYPPARVPVLTEPSPDEKRIAELQLGYAARMRKSQYYLVEKTKTTELERYSDKYRPSAATQPTLKRKDLHAPFFPTEVFEDYFNPKRKKKPAPQQPTTGKVKMNLEELAEDAEDEEKSSEERSDAGSQAAESDYDVDEEYGENDYAENYFDNGEGDDNDDLGGGGGGDDGGGGDYD